MRGKELLSRRAASNLAAAKMDLAAATQDDDEDRITLLETVLSSGADILVYRPQLQHYALLFGDLVGSTAISTSTGSTSGRFPAMRRPSELVP